jgi:hypothetical protein
MPQALALAAQMVATLALFVVLALGLFVLGLAFRANRPPASPARSLTTGLRRPAREWSGTETH